MTKGGKLLVTLLQKSIQELEMITEGFMSGYVWDDMKALIRYEWLVFKTNLRAAETATEPEPSAPYDSLVEAIEPILLKLEEKIGKVQGVIYEHNSVVIHSVNQYENRDKYRSARQFLDEIGVNSWCSKMDNLMICL